MPTESLKMNGAGKCVWLSSQKTLLGLPANTFHHRVAFDNAFQKVSYKHQLNSTSYSLYAMFVFFYAERYISHLALAFPFQSNHSPNQVIIPTYNLPSSHLSFRRRGSSVGRARDSWSGDRGSISAPHAAPYWLGPCQFDVTG